MKADSILLRQVHPAFCQGDYISHQVFKITSQVFKPTKKDEGMLSVYDGEKFSPSDSYDHYTCKLQLPSVGTLGVSVDECVSISLSAIEDNERFDGHCLIDFSHLTNNEIDKKAKILKSFAEKRGWLFYLNSIA